jgi:hypothetical protein
LQHHGPAKGLYGVGIAAVRHVAVAYRDERERINGIKPRSDGQFGKRLLVTAQACVRRREIAMGGCVIRVQPDTLFERFDGTLERLVQGGKRGDPLVYLPEAGKCRPSAGCLELIQCVRVAILTNKELGHPPSEMARIRKDFDPTFQRDDR